VTTKALQPAGSRLAQAWGEILDFALVLWVVRVPLVSVAAGLLLMAAITEAQDVMVHVAMAGAPLAKRAWISWELVQLFASTFLFWAMPVHYAARLLLETDRGLAARIAPVAKAGPGARAAAASGALGWVILLVPRVLGALAFVAFAIGARLAIANLPTIDDTPVVTAAREQLDYVSWVMLAGVPAFFAYAAVRVRMVKSGPMADLDRWLAPRVAGFFRRIGLGARADDPAGELYATGRLTLLIYAVGVAVVLVANPVDLARALPLAAAVPLVFGGWVPLLSFFSALGRRLHFPFLLTLFALGVAGVAVFGDNHAVRLRDAAPPARASLRQGLDMWMEANGCAGKPQDCPRPVIVAGAGGASRAGFFTASVIGHFLDVDRFRKGSVHTQADQTKTVHAPLDDGRLAGKADGQPVLNGAQVRNRIFAISGVSGSAYGAAVIAGALAASGPPGGAVPCPREALASSYWFGKKINTWRDCLEALTAGDYLTAVFFGLAFHDQVQLWVEDRATLLEKAWEARFADLVSQAPAVAAADAQRPDGQKAAERLAQPFLALPRSAASWVPFLVLNGTSVDTGQRIVTTDLDPTMPAAPCLTGGPTERCPIFTHALDFHALIPERKDVALSTAASNSARFPVISPPGAIQGRKSKVADRIVDGGYFENYGVESALDLAKAIVALDPRLAPFILVISNDPQVTLGEAGAGEGPAQPEAADTLWLGEVAGPLGAISAVRGGRGRLAQAEARAFLGARLASSCGPHMAHIKVAPETREGDCPAEPKRQDIRAVAMSWWLSQPVQINLREQTKSARAKSAEGKSGWAGSGGGLCSNDREIAAVWTALATPSSACLRVSAAAQPAPALPPSLSAPSSPAPPSGGIRQTP
jgi:hypothetical protein